MGALGQQVVADGVLGGTDQLAGVVAKLIAEVFRLARVVDVVRIGIVRIVDDVVDRSPVVAAGVGEVEVADLAGDRQRRLVPLIVVALRAVGGDIEAAEERLVPERAVGALLLVGDARTDRPLFVQVELQGKPSAAGADVVVRILAQGRVVARHARGRIHLLRAGDVVDVAGIPLAEADQADGRGVVDRPVDVGLCLLAGATVPGLVDRQVVTGVGALGVRLVGDVANGACHRARPEQRALRAGQRLDAFHVIDVHVERGADRRHRLFVEIDPDHGLCAGLQSVRAVRQAPEVDLRLAGPQRLEGQAGHVLGNAGEIRDMQLGQLLGVKGLHADRHGLQVFRTLLRGHDDFLQTAAGGLGVGRRPGRGGRQYARNGAGQRRHRAGKDRRTTGTGPHGCYS